MDRGLRSTICLAFMLVATQAGAVLRRRVPRRSATSIRNIASMSAADGSSSDQVHHLRPVPSSLDALLHPSGLPRKLQEGASASRTPRPGKTLVFIRPNNFCASWPGVWTMRNRASTGSIAGRGWTRSSSPWIKQHLRPASTFYGARSPAPTSVEERRSGTVRQVTGLRQTLSPSSRSALRPGRARSTLLLGPEILSVDLKAYRQKMPIHPKCTCGRRKLDATLQANNQCQLNLFDF